MPSVHFLNNVSLFANLSTTELEPLAERLVSRRYQAGEPIFAQNSPGNSLYIVKSGRVEIVLNDPQGHTQTLAEFGPGQAFGEFGLLDGLPRSAGAVARERSELLTLSRPEFFMYLEQYPSVAIKLLVLLSRRLRFVMQRGESDEIAEQETPQTRLAQLLVELADRYGRDEEAGLRLPLRLTRGEIAGLLGCPRAQAEAALRTLQDEGVLTMHGRQITLHDLEKLRARVSR